MKTLLRRGILLSFGTVFGLLVVELMARSFLPAPLPWKSPNLRYEADEFCGYRFEPNQVGYMLTGRATINRWGFRGPDWKVNKAVDVVRIALLGDSMVFGAGVNDEETFGAQLERILNARAAILDKRFEVLNFGVPGYDTGNELEVLKRYALQFNPDLVLLNFYLNDLLYIQDYSIYPKLFEQSEKEFSLWRWKLRELARRSRLVMTLWDFWQTLGKNPMAQLEHSYVYEGVAPPKGPGENGWHFVDSKLKVLHDLSLSNGFRVALVILPLPQEVLDQKVRASYTDFLVERSGKLGIVPVDILSNLRSSGRGAWEILIPYDYHFNKEGHQIVAESLSYVVKNMLENGTVQQGGARKHE